MEKTGMYTSPEFKRGYVDAFDSKPVEQEVLVGLHAIAASHDDQVGRFNPAAELLCLRGIERQLAQRGTNPGAGKELCVATCVHDRSVVVQDRLQ